jgi:hypothetical protein
LNPCYRRESGSDSHFAGFAQIVQNEPFVNSDAGIERLYILQLARLNGLTP